MREATAVDCQHQDAPLGECATAKTSNYVRGCLERDTFGLPLDHPCRDCSLEYRLSLMNRLTVRELFRWAR
ncbi:hypothetical protein [Methylogaea oryzae]|uniref:Uncharacterized protein n=1 Tax=Methylogaea oryzae TaxID=1295382 RepID=A0A8D5AP98_9GAMM|nr:hypothetical protein [Methylogaea oryzae]BBL72840.1 hypothetical protein MoryE10_34460 [Methylogaea oryzae]